MKDGGELGNNGQGMLDTSHHIKGGRTIGLDDRVDGQRAMKIKQKSTVFEADMRIGQFVRFFFRYRRFPLRDRYWRRSNGRFRLRYALLGYTVLSALVSFSTLAAINGGMSLPFSVQSTFQGASQKIAEDSGLPWKFKKGKNEDPSLQGLNPEHLASALNSFRDAAGQIRRSAVAKAAVAVVQETEARRLLSSKQQLTIAAGDTLSDLLVQAGVSSSEAQGAIKVIRKHIHPGDLRPGQIMNLEGPAPSGSNRTLDRLTLVIDPVRTLEVRHGWSGFMTARMIEKPLKADMAASVAVIRGSLYGAATAAGVPAGVTAEAIKALGHQIDFQRDIQPGDKLEIMYDRMVTEEGYVARTGGLVFARLYADDRELTIYRFDTRDGHRDYFDKKGNSIRKALLRTPMDGARVTSGFGMRRHPILGYSKMHKGIDFGAAVGTPVFAAGDGTIEMAGRFGAYGNYVRVKHNNALKTAYAHLSRYASGVRSGAHVRQGQVIGYVGTTGRSTGPHLHYEILLNNAHINPHSVKLPTMVSLTGAELRKFKEQTARIEQQFKDRTNGIRYASADDRAVRTLSKSTIQ